MIVEVQALLFVVVQPQEYCKRFRSICGNSEGKVEQLFAMSAAIRQACEIKKI